MRLLVVEDDRPVREMLMMALSEDGHQVVGAESAEVAMRLATPGAFEGFLLDVKLPEISGTDLCRWLRANGIKAPILMLTALSSVSDKVEGLDSGADDYLAKPFDVAEIRARFRAFQRKALGYPRAPLVVADLRLDPESGAVSRAGRPLALSRREVQLLEYLMKNVNRVVTRAMIAAAVWDSKTTLYSNVIDVFLSNLRRKIDAEEPRLLHTVRRKGFMLSAGPGGEE